MNWKDPKVELPKQGQIVWVLYQHNKEHNPRSCQLMCGEVSWNNNQTSCFVDSNDFTGSGSWSVRLLDNEDDRTYCNDEGIAWIDTKDFKLPEWVPHDPHWGPKE